MFWSLQGYNSEGLAWSRAALESAPNARATLRASALHAASELALQSGNYDSAEPLAQESLAQSREAGDDRLIAQALNLLGRIAFIGHGDLARGELLCAEAKLLFERVNDTGRVEYSLFNLGRIALYRRDLPRAEQYGQQLITPSLSSRRSRLLGSVAYHRGNLDRAALLYREALETSQRTGQRYGIGWFLCNLGWSPMRPGILGHRRRVLCTGTG